MHPNQFVPVTWEQERLACLETYLRKMLTYHRGNLTRTAKAVGVARCTLYAMLEETGKRAEILEACRQARLSRRRVVV